MLPPPTSTLFPYTTLFRSHLNSERIFKNKFKIPAASVSENIFDLPEGKSIIRLIRQAGAQPELQSPRVSFQPADRIHPDLAVQFEIGRASCRERGEVSVERGTRTKKKV